MTTLVLYRREPCPLCAHAEEALRGAGVDPVAVERIDIGWDGPLAERYGTRIPVLRDVARELELEWPFDPWDVRRFLEYRPR